LSNNDNSDDNIIG